MKCGGTGDVKVATPEVQQLCDQLKADVEKHSGENYNEFVAIEYKTQVVAGTNYFIKVHVGCESYVHLRVYKPLPHTGKPAELSSCQTSKTKHDSISYF
ncbi:cystatin-B-like [Lissotriton helveticus]